MINYPRVERALFCENVGTLNHKTNFWRQGTLGVYAKIHRDYKADPDTPFLNHSQTATNTLGSARTVASKKIIIKKLHIVPYLWRLV